MTPELSRPLRAAQIPAEGLSVEVEATAAECAALALRLGIPALLSLSCRFRLAPLPGGAVAAAGRLRARMVRDCVVSLEPFETRQDARFRLRFVPDDGRKDDGRNGAGLDADADFLDPDADDEIPFTAGVIDLGEAAAEQLALELDPYPRAPGAVLPEAATGPEGGAFAALAALRRPAGGE